MPVSEEQDPKLVRYVETLRAECAYMGPCADNFPSGCTCSAEELDRRHHASLPPDTAQGGEGIGGRVKPLEWTKRKGCDEWFADTVAGRYEVGQVGRGFIATLRNIGETGDWDDTVLLRNAPAAVAKAAAQSDYETRILSTLQVQTSEAVATGGDLSALRAANIKRQVLWCPDEAPDLSFRGNELGGEVGEALNVIKKLERERHGWRGSRDSTEHLAEELADVVICADLCAITAGIDLASAVVAKFNATSDKVGIPVHLASPPSQPALREALGVLDAMIEEAGHISTRGLRITRRGALRDARDRIAALSEKPNDAPASQAALREAVPDADWLSQFTVQNLNHAALDSAVGVLRIGMASGSTQQALWAAIVDYVERAHPRSPQ
jgi:NTP pyrophosphatase (non-canonical NTP hydrolase)